MLSRFRLPALTLIALTALALPARAAPADITQEGADALKPGIAAALQALGASLQSAGITLNTTGDLMVEPAGTYYAVTTPAISLKLPGNITRTVGMVAINAIPTNDPDVYKVAIALPTPMMDTDATGKNTGSLAIGQQAMNGLLHTQALTFTELNAAYKNVRLVNSTAGTETLLPDATIALRLMPTQGGAPGAAPTWSGPADIMVHNYSRREPGQKYTIGTLTIRAMIDQIDLLAKKAANANGPTLSLNGVLGAYIGRTANAADIDVNASNITLQTTINNTPQSISIANAALRTNLTGLKSGIASGKFNMTASGGAAGNPQLAQTMPTNATMAGTITKFPVQDALSAAGGAAFWNVLKNASTGLVADSLSLEAPAYSLTGKADLKANAKAPLGVSGESRLAIRGMEELLTWLGGPAGLQTFGLPPIPPAAIGALAMVQMTGMPGKDAQGRDIRNFDVTLSPDGKITLNGADITSVGEAFKTR